LVLNERDKVTHSIRKNGYDASNLYEPLTRIYTRVQKKTKFENAEFIGDHIINLWVDPSINSDYINGICNTIMDELN
jgi:dTDP-4-amino-4,6-dideoxygalactose transaminase